ncbi:SDR family oxidoreductase [Nostocaceae cyanobacterium CENA357]|uniref:SDR family oxidoreductase n=1 Tax=Atlanticothrix silvestris CENA357 TaxID=1725252 RepID=A0A8J7L2T4_9CYAN|nr:SDR family oxidoreductase [Atlanticothrix silvestris]MBH8553151.1 SDR family oxidoreductase [Atlanticothrix silvestris CENA357]
MQPLSHRVALITGSTSGIGLTIAKRLAMAGMTIALHSKSSVEAGTALAAELGNASYTQADLANEVETRNLIHQVINHHGRLDVIINNAGINEVIPHADLKQATPEIWEKLYKVNVIAPWVLISEAETALRDSATEEHPSCIINISSHAGVRPKGASIPYAVSKAALNHLTRLLAVALAPTIRVNAIAPGLVETPMTAEWVAAKELWQNRAPMRRGAKPEEIADIAMMLVASDYITGEAIVIDGGLNLT